ncbi:MAG TPA: FtsQ-type POTRA domain-containing protein [Candidatus Limnocylindrales bacterium]|nr:FtsQ-type POTRA domain-containing protein [Candidatus Limnocylindrales bacterium]
MTPARAAALLGLVAALVAGYGLMTAPVFAIRSIDVSPLQYTDPTVLLGRLGVGTATNAFRLTTAGLAERIEGLPAVSSASVSIELPDRLVVSVTERTAILAWRVGAVTFLVDRDGMLFHWVATGSDAAAGLPTIVDRRSLSPVALSVGTPLDAVDLDAATRLASLGPADVGSRATGLAVSITDADGFVVTTTPGSWTAVFGSYGQVLRSPDLIPGQVRLLRSLLYERGEGLARIVLADDQNGTYVPLPSGHG